MIWTPSDFASDSLLLWFAPSADIWFDLLLIYVLGPLLNLVPDSLLLSDSHPLLTFGSVHC